MAFSNNVVRPFTRSEILAINPNQMGVYGIFRANQWIYVGCGNIRQRLLDHLNGDNPSILRQGPTHWVTEVTPAYIAREKQLIGELQPTCNLRAG
jgi:hypothetical protein